MKFRNEKKKKKTYKSKELLLRTITVKETHNRKTLFKNLNFLNQKKRREI